MVYRTISRRSEGKFTCSDGACQQTGWTQLVFLGFGCATFCIQPIYLGPGIYKLFLVAQ